MEYHNKTKEQLIAELKQLKNKLEQLENKKIILKYNKFVSDTKDNITFIDKDYLYFDVNNTYLKTHNLKREDIVGKFVEDIFGREIFTKYIKQNIDKCLSGSVIKYQKWFEFPKSERKYLDVVYHPVFDDNHNMLGVMVSSHDITDLKITEELLSERNQKYDALLQNTPGMVYMGITDWTKEIVGGAEAVCGYPDIELKTGQLEWKNIIHPEDKERIHLETEKLFKKAQSEICVYRIITKQGETRWVEDRMTSFFYEAEGNFRIDGIVNDITAKKKIKEILKESEVYFRSLIENSTDVISIIDSKGTIMFESPSHKRVLGYEDGDLIGENCFKYVHPDDRVRIIRQFEGLVEKPDKIENVNFRFLHKDKTWLYIEGTSKNLLNTLSIKGIVVNYRDITRLKKAEKAIKESEEKYRYLIENQGEGVGIVDLNETFTFANPAAEEIFGQEKAGLVGRHLTEFFSAEQFKIIKDQTKNRIQKKTNAYELVLTLPDKQKRDILVTATPSLDTNGAIIGALGIFRDITKRKKAEKNLKKREKQLRDLNATKDKFFSIIAHDLRSPFNSMLGFSRLLVGKFDEYDVQKQKKFLGFVHDGLENTYKLLENLLVWSQMQGNVTDYRPVKENLFLLAVGSIDVFSQMAANKEITIVNKIHENTYVFADKDMLAIVLRNLISNAIKFTPKGGTIKIGVETRHGVSQYGIYVKDNGQGIKPEIQARLFKISENISTEGTENEKGTGLGLILCKEFVEKHGGKIWVESEVGVGSKFIFTIPKTEKLP